MKMPTVILATLLFAACASYGDESIRDYGSDWPPLSMSKAELISRLGTPRAHSLECSRPRGRNHDVVLRRSTSEPGPDGPRGRHVCGSQRQRRQWRHAIAASGVGPDGKMVSRSWSQGRIGKGSSSAPPNPNGSLPKRYDPTAAGAQ